MRINKLRVPHDHDAIMIEKLKIPHLKDIKHL